MSGNEDKIFSSRHWALKHGREGISYRAEQIQRRCFLFKMLGYRWEKKSRMGDVKTAELRVNRWRLLRIQDGGDLCLHGRMAFPRRGRASPLTTGGEWSGRRQILLALPICWWDGGGTSMVVSVFSEIGNSLTYWKWEEERCQKEKIRKMPNIYYVAEWEEAR